MSGRIELNLKCIWGPNPILAAKPKAIVAIVAKRSAEMIRKSMMNLVGYASNLMTETFMVTDRDWLAQQLGFKSGASMDERLNYFVRVGTDGFKTNVDQEPVRKHMGILQQKMLKMFGVMAPWTSWPNDWAFARGIPEVNGETKRRSSPS